MQIYTVYMQPALVSSCFAKRQEETGLTDWWRGDVGWWKRRAVGRHRVQLPAEDAARGRQPERHGEPHERQGAGTRRQHSHGAYSWPRLCLLAPLAVPALRCAAIYRRSFLLFSRCWTALPVSYLFVLLYLIF
jgi:hypothetical protein